MTRQDEEFLETVIVDIDINGSFKIKVADDGIFLKVSAPKGRGKFVSIVDVNSVIEEKEFVEVDWQMVRQTINNAEDTWQLIAPRKPELDRDAKISIQISKDKLQAFLSYRPALGGKDITEKELREFISAQGISFGIIEDNLKEIINKKKEAESILIAEGLPPTPGKDSSLEFHFKTESSSIGTKREDGSVDFYNLGLINNVRKGDILVSKIPSEPGIPGKAITGEEIPAPLPKEVSLPRGKNTEIKDDEILVAAISGQVVLDENNRVQVLPIYEVNGDVDLSTGNIEFVGNVIVKGDVREGFRIKAEGNVEVRGNVEVADIEADGDVIIYRGFIGKNKCEIKARGDVRVRFVENGVIKAGKSIFISDAAMHSKLFAGENITVNEKKGLLVGGIARAGKKIEANIVGSSLATLTYLEAGVDPELKNKVKKLEDENARLRTNLIKTDKAISILEQLKEKTGSLTEDKLIMYSQLARTKTQLEKDIQDVSGQLREVQSELAMGSKGSIEVRKRVYPGVKITIGNAQLNIQNEQTGCEFIEQDGEITQLSIGW